MQYQSRDGRARAATVRAVNTRAKPQRYTIAFDTDQLCVSSACLFSTKPPPPSATVDDAAVDDAAEALQQQFRCGQRVWYYDAAPVPPEDADGDDPSLECSPCEHAEGAPAGMVWADQCACRPIDSADGDTAEAMDCASHSCQPCAAKPAPRAPCRARIEAAEADGTYTITLEGAERETTELQLAPLPDACEPSSPSLSPMPQDTPVVLDPDCTVSDAKLFNRAARIVVVTADVENYWDRWCVHSTASCMPLP